MKTMRSFCCNEQPALRTRTWCLLLGIFAALCGLLLFMTRTAQTGTIAVVRVNGETVWMIDLATVTEPIEHTIITETGSNVLRAEHGKICILSADCADETCVHMGWLSGGRTPLVCLPHRLTVQIESSPAVEEEIDAIVG